MLNQASYRKLLDNGKLVEKVNKFKEHLESCKLCPHECAINRRTTRGFCQAKEEAIVSSYGPHYGEEAVLTGNKGSGTIFFAYCNMRCVYCQNHSLSFSGQGRTVSNEELADIMLEIQNKYRCHNINLVTPTHYLVNIVEAVYIAAKKGLNLPLVYNTSAYEKAETLDLLDGLVDIYMPDFKYFTNESGEKYSQVKNYSDIAKTALRIMNQQVGGLKKFMGIAYRGLLVRHLVLPGNLEETKEILNFIKKELSPDTLVNLMDQYYPANLAYKYENINRPLRESEYKKALDYALDLDLQLVRQ